jgi:nucleoside-diphosphate-sugar epimerase
VGAFCAAVSVSRVRSANSSASPSIHKAMNVLITGGAGFLGRRLTQKLLERGTLRGSDRRERYIDRIMTVDLEDSPFRDDRVQHVVGDIADSRVLQRAIDPETTSIFHLAAVVSGMAESNFELGMRINVDASRMLLDLCRATAHCPRVVFTSSVAVYGGEMPDVVTDATALNPQSSYGTQKAIVELAIADYTRRGFIDGRVLRLPTISVRPGRPNAAASSFVSGIIREPLNGEPSVCPVDPATRVWVLSPARAIDCLIAGHELSGDALGRNRFVNLPGLSVTVGEMIAALERVAGPEVVRRIRIERDPRVERIVASWPGAWDVSRARSLGLPGDRTFDDVVRAYMSERVIPSSSSTGHA